MTAPDGTLRAYDAVPSERIGIRPPGFRLPDATRVGRVSLQVADLDRSLAFYRDLIGFRLLDRTESSGIRVATLGAHGDETALLTLREKVGVRAMPHRGRIGIYHLAVLLPTRADLGRFLRHVSGRGVHVGAADHFFSEATYLVDPDGITIEVYRDRPRGEWGVSAAGELVAASDPLDYGGLLAVAGSEPYEGLPSGTRVGHMHFYVGDLEQAARFYHDALGFAKVGWTYPGALFVSAGQYHHHVGLNVWAAGAPVATDDDARLLDWELVVPDQATADAAAESLRTAGYTVSASRDGYAVDDPWGIRARIVPADS